MKCNAFLKQIDGSLKSIFGTFKGYNGYATIGNSLVDVKIVKPYLRPMSNMTDKELVTFLEIKGMNLKSGDLQSFREGQTAIVSTLPSYSRHIDWLNAHHFDYRGLIEKGLALEAPEGMYEI